MGFLDKLKNIANQITGAGAKVTLAVQATDVKSKINITIHAEVKDAPIEISKVYLYVKSVESINISNKALPGGESQNAQPISLNHDIFAQKEYIVAQAQTLESGKTYDWTYDLILPEGSMASYNGKYTNHQWQFYAGLDAKGNDPDSGWVSVVLK